MRSDVCVASTAEPHNIKRLGIIFVVRLDPVCSQAQLAEWRFNQAPGAHGVKH